jgi:uncharacterized protein (DUF2267 family)
VPGPRHDAFDHMTQTANAWLVDIASAFGTEDRRFAYRVLRAWLHALRDRLTVDHAAQFAAQLPELIRGVYYDGWNPSSTPMKYGPEEYVQRFASEARIPHADVPGAATRVSAVLQQHFSPGQLEEALTALPESLKRLITESNTVPADADTVAAAPTAEDRIGRLEDTVSNLTEALRTLARGLEEVPGTEPDEHRIAKAARLAHELLLAAKE